MYSFYLSLATKKRNAKDIVVKAENRKEKINSNVNIFL